MKLKNSNCDETQKLKKPIFDKTKKKIKNLNLDETQFVRKKLNKSKCDQTEIGTKLKNSNCDQAQKFKL